MKRISVIIFTLIFCYNCKAQHKSIDFEINVAAIGDDYMDNEYEWDRFGGALLTQLCAGYTFSLNNKLTASPRLAYGFSFEYYLKRQVSPTGGSLNDQTYVEKDNKMSFLKTGMGLSYWFFNTGKGLYMDSEIQGVYLISASSRIRTQVGTGEIEDITVDFKDQIRGFVPSVRFSVGYNLHIKRVSCFIKLSRDLRFSSYFRSAENNSLLSPGFALGLSYILQKSDSSN